MPFVGSNFTIRHNLSYSLPFQTLCTIAKYHFNYKKQDYLTVMLFLEQALSWDLFEWELYFSFQIIEEFFFFFFFSIRSLAVHNRWLKASVQSRNEKTSIAEKWTQMIWITAAAKQLTPHRLHFNTGFIVSGYFTLSNPDFIHYY